VIKLKLDELKSLIKGARVQGNNVYGNCPYCDHDEFGISISKLNHPFGCFRKKECGEAGQSIHKLLKFLGRDDLTNTVNYTKPLDLGLLDEVKEKLKLSLNEMPTISLPLGYKRLYVKGGTKQDSYLINERGFTENDFERYEVGSVRIEPKYTNYVVFPIYQNNELKGLVGRNYTGKDIPKYSNSNSTDFAQLVYGLNEINKTTHTIIVVEGIFDKINVDRVFCNFNEGFVCVCTFGAKISDGQIKQIKNKQEKLNLILCFDPDVIKVINKHSFALESHFDKVFVILSPIGKDAGEVSILEFKKMMSAKKTPIQFFTGTLISID